MAGSFARPFQTPQALALGTFTVVLLLALFSHVPTVSAAQSGCLAKQMQVADVPSNYASTYEKALAKKNTPPAYLSQVPPLVLQIFGVSNSGHANAIHVCFAGAKRSPACKSYKECTGRGQCKLQKSAAGERQAPYTCHCHAGYTGSRCQTDACHKTCQNGASCKRTSVGQRFQCSCKAGYSGTRCQTAINRCTPNPCANGGLCRPLPNDFVCSCSSGYAGKKCESHLLKESEFDGKLAKVAKQVDNAIAKIDQKVSSLASFVRERLDPTCAPHSRRSIGKSGVFTARYPGLSPFQAYCDRTTAGGGWIVISRRRDSSVNFRRGWADYKRGFGSLTGNFWLGLEKMHAITSSGQYELRVDLIDMAGRRKAATYSSFRVDGEGKKFQLHLSGFEGHGVSNGLLGHNGNYFTTYDRDNDRYRPRNCASLYRGVGWWYFGCLGVLLTGPVPVHSGQAFWFNAAMKSAEMKMRTRL